MSRKPFASDPLHRFRPGAQLLVERDRLRLQRALLAHLVGAEAEVALHRGHDVGVVRRDTSGARIGGVTPGPVSAQDEAAARAWAARALGEDAPAQPGRARRAS